MAGLAALPMQGQAQQAKTIGLLWNDSVKPSPHVATLIGALGPLGWTLGRNLKVEDKVALEGYGGYAENAAALVRGGCDVIATYGYSATSVVAKATKEIPIAMLIGTDPVRAGLAKSLAQPGGNVTGLMNLSEGLIGKRLELLRELVPGIKDVGILIADIAVQRGLVMEEARRSAAKLDVNVQVAAVKTPQDIEPALDGLAKAGVRAVYVSQGTLVAAHAARVVKGVAASKLAAVYPTDRFADAGGLLTYGSSATKAFVRLASYVDRLLLGARPGSMPIEQMSDAELVINLKTAKAMGFRIPQSILQRADRAIE